MESIIIHPSVWERLQEKTAPSFASPPYGVKVITNPFLPENVIVTDDGDTWSVWKFVFGEFKKVKTFSKFKYNTFNFDWLKNE